MNIIRTNRSIFLHYLDILLIDFCQLFTEWLDPPLGNHRLVHVTPEEVANFLSNYQDFKKNNMGRWAVVRKDDEDVLGWCGLKLHTNGLVDLGFRLFKKYWNQGYATEASLGCLAYGFETLLLTEIVGRVVPANMASARVLKKIGMHFSHFEVDEHHGEQIAIYKITDEDFRRN